MTDSSREPVDAPTDGAARLGIAPPGHRLPAGTRVGAVHLQVADLARSRAYYEEVLGLRVIADAGPGRLALGVGGNDSPLVHLDERRGAAAVLPQGRLGLYHFAILLPDRAALGRFVAHLAQRGERVGASDHLVSEALYLHDPDGLGIEVYADRPRAEWRAVDGQLEMATLPLDLAALSRDVAGAPWTGMPAGTTMGHVHLHVGDLAAASGFYHAALGLDAMVWRYPGALFLAAGGYHHHLGVNVWAGPSAVPAPLDEARLIAWRLELPTAHDVGAARRSLEAAGHPVTDLGRGFSVADPWGTVLQIVTAEPLR